MTSKLRISTGLALRRALQRFSLLLVFVVGLGIRIVFVPFAGTPDVDIDVGWGRTAFLSLVCLLLGTQFINLFGLYVFGDSSLSGKVPFTGFDAREGVVRLTIYSYRARDVVAYLSVGLFVAVLWHVLRALPSTRLAVTTESSE